MKPLAQSDFVADRGIAGRVAARLVPAVRATRGFFARRRKLAMAIASILFVGGLAWAVDSAGIALARIEGQWLVAALALGFVGVILNGFELSRCAGALGKKVPAPEAINLSSVGILSNLLPIPASALVRGGALMATGATLAQSGRILLYVGLLRVSVAGAITGLALISGPFGWPVVAGSCLASAILFALIAQVGGIISALRLLGLRIAMLAGIAMQLWFCFHALGTDAGLSDAALQSIAPVVGSAVGIVPGGLGVSEAIGAALALLVNGSSAMAFAALALNRLVGYACAGLTVLAFQARRAFIRK
ncbi:hypothetical protein AAG607_07785 [Citromicrobium bathyomarinum]|uniref:hypothetical protein n=1 Tax=Sphingomonadales TaxID=204457 RepID=UPI000C4C170D|nr:hypothetical protein [Citromicrobium sp.]